MPASVTALLDTFDGVNLNIDALGLPLPCLQLGTFFDRLLFVMLSPCVIALLIVAWCTTAEALAASRSSTRLKGGLLRALPYLLGLSFLTFPMVSSLAFQAFSCESFVDGNYSFLRADYSLNCDADEYDAVWNLAWAAIALYPLAVPLVCLALLLSTRKAILTEQPTPLSRSLAFLHHDYDPSMFWWETVEIAKKVRQAHPFISHLTSHQQYPLQHTLAALPGRVLRAHPAWLHEAAHHRLRLLAASALDDRHHRPICQPIPQLFCLDVQLLSCGAHVLQPCAQGGPTL